MATTNKRARVSTLLGNTRVLALIAFLLALVIWLAVSINESPVVERVVRDVKIEVDGSMPSARLRGLRRRQPLCRRHGLRQTV